MTKTSWKERMALIAGGTLVGIFLLEIILRIYGVGLDQRRADLQENLDGNYRILALGESTTDAMVAPDHQSWTHFLQKKLNQSLPGKKIVVINMGRAGVSTDFMVRDLPDYIEEFHPHLIITMAGINDWMPLKFLHEDNFFSRLRIVRMVRLLTMKKSPTVPPPEIQEELKNALGKYKVHNQIPQDFQNWLQKYPDYKWYGYQQITLASYWLTRNIADSTKKKQDYETTFRFAIKTLELNPSDDLALMKYLYSADNHKAEARQFLKDQLRKGIVPSPTNAPFIHLVNAVEDKELISLLQEKGLEINQSHSMENLRKNYQKMAKMAQNAGIKLAVMSYPTTNPEIFKAFFDPNAKLPRRPLLESAYEVIDKPQIAPEFQEITFIDNLNFPIGFDRDIYIDQMSSHPNGKGGFGHTTKKGHEMIAENAWKALQKIISQNNSKL